VSTANRSTAQPLNRVAVAAHAKANLFLRILSREPSGYHGLETVFTLLDLADELTVERIEGGIELTVEGTDTGPAEANLAYRAADLVLNATGRRFGVRIRLVKRIPVAAGLGGGSSDGAAALRAVNALAGNAVPGPEIFQFATKLGADVAFFASGAPLALAWGRGERLFRLRPPAAAPVLLVLPDFGVSTAKAYELADQGRDWTGSRGPVLLEADAFTTWGGIARLGGNDFEVPVFGKEPVLRELYEKLCGTGPLLARLSGSGSALFGVYRNERDRDDAAMVLAGLGRRVVSTATRPRSAPEPEPT